MKKYIITVFLALSVVSSISCANNGEKSSAVGTNSDHGVVYLDKATFIKEVFDYETNKEWSFKGNVPVILDFYADWCGPCKMLAPVLEELQSEYKGKIQVYKINTDKQKELAGAFGIRSLPTIVFVPMQGQPQAVMGFRSKEDMVKMIGEVLKVTKP